VIRLLRAVSAFLVRFIPPQLANGDFETTQRAYVLVHTSLIGIPGVIMLVQGRLRYGTWGHPFVLIGAVLTLLPLAIPPLLRATGSVRLVGALNPVALLVLFPWVIVHTGGLTSPMLSYYFVSMLYVAYFLGMRWGAVVWLVCAAQATWLWRLHEAGRIALVPLDFVDALAGFVTTGALLLVFAFLYDRGSLHARAVLGRKEAALVAAKHEAESAAELKARFLATMSHEIRTPLNGVLGMTSLLFDTPLTEAQRDLVETLRGSGDSLLGLLNDVLDFSKIEAGQMRLEEQPFDLFTCVESAFDLFAVPAAAKGVELFADIDADVPRALRGDVTRLRQVLVNLLGNAVKFTEKGEVGVRVRAVPGGAGDRVTLRFEVQDSGIGIAPDRLPQLFQPFVQADASTTRTHGGTGLGLAICRRLVELMGGLITAESAPGGGTVFRFELVLAVGEGTTDNPVAHAVGSDGLAVLLVEDHGPTRAVLVRWLRAWGHNVVEARSASEARSRCADMPDLESAVIDRTLTDEDGEALATEIAGAGIHVVLLAPRTGGANTRPNIIRLLKPVRHDQLRDVLYAALRGSMSMVRRAIPLFGEALATDHPLRILVAEDNPVNQKVVRLMLAQVGYTADFASDGHEAIDALRRQQYDLVLMDVQMPGVDGIEVTRYLRRSLPAAAQPRIVAMTAYVALDERRACAEAGMDAFVSKPVVPEELIRALRETKRSATVAVESSPTRPSQFAPKMEPEVEGPLDPRLLRSLQKLAAQTPGLYAELINEHVTHVEEHLGRLRAAIAEGDQPTVLRIAHTVKGSSAQMGARGVARVAALLETAVPGGKPEAAREQLAALEAEWRRARAALCEERDRAGAALQ
jgi:signal transduction histidine kinase/DNA-binding response OmpR family regulator/HPt (histidine-containing phosphotransfer) domain-containing protein